MAYIKNDGWQQQRQAHQEMPQKGLWPVFRSLKIRSVLTVVVQYVQFRFYSFLGIAICIFLRKYLFQSKSLTRERAKLVRKQFTHKICSSHGYDTIFTSKPNFLVEIKKHKHQHDNLKTYTYFNKKFSSVIV